MRGTLSALAFCHNRSVAHGSMGSGSILVSTYDDRRANDLIVKLDNFGFGRAHYACSLDLKGGMSPCSCRLPSLLFLCPMYCLCIQPRQRRRCVMLSSPSFAFTVLPLLPILLVPAALTSKEVCHAVFRFFCLCCFFLLPLLLAPAA